MEPLYDKKHDGLILISENKDRGPLDKELLLAEPPYTDVMGFGKFAGRWSNFIRLSFSPIKNFPPNDLKAELAENDTRNYIYTIDKLIKWLKRRVSKHTVVLGGEPFYKYEEVRYLFSSIFADTDQTLTNITCGLCIPEFVEKAYYMEDHYFILMPQLFGAVPEDELVAYKIYLKDQLKVWKKFDKAQDFSLCEFVFYIDPYNMEQVYEIIFFLQEVDWLDAKVTFLPYNLFHVNKLQMEIAKLLPNFKGDVRVAIDLNPLNTKCLDQQATKSIY